MPAAQQTKVIKPATIKVRNVTYSLPVELIEKVEELAIEENRKKSNMLAEIIERYLAANTPAKS